MSNKLDWPLPSHPESDFVLYPPECAARYERSGYWTGRTLTRQLLDVAARHGDARALMTTDGALTYDELMDAASCLARGLVSRARLAPGDAVMFQMGNVAETVVAYIAALFAGLKPVCTLPQHGEREISLLAQHVGARALFIQADFGRGQLTEQAARLQGAGIIEEVVVFRGSAPTGMWNSADLNDASSRADERPLPGEARDPNEIAVFQLSGGTTGLPKVSPRTHNDYAYNSTAWAEALALVPEDVVLYALPIMHNAGIIIGLQSVLLSGAALLLAPSADADVLLTLVEDHHPSAFPLVPPAVAIRLVEHERAAHVDFGSLRHFIVGGQKLAPEIAVRLEDVLGIRLQQKFGMAEGMFLVTPRDASPAVRHHTVGAPISPADEVRILVPGSEVPVDEGEVGEFCARGPYTIRGYYRASAHNAAAFTSDGFYRTGDLARSSVIDGRVYYSIEGRIKDVINRGAEKIHAEEVEEILLRHPRVDDAAVVAMPDRVLGEKVCAYLVVGSGAVESDLDVASIGRFLLDQGLAKYKLPERIERVEALPLTNVGKVSKKDLREDVTRKLAEEAAAPRLTD